ASGADEVLAGVEGDVKDADLRAEIVTQRATHQLFLGNFNEAIALTEPVMSRPDDRPYVMGALSASVARALAGRTEEAIKISDRAFHARIALGDQSQISGPGVYLVARSLALAEAGQLADADEWARLGYAGAVEQQVR